MATNGYAAREAGLLRRLAMATLADPKAAPEDRQAARERLRENTADLSRLTDAELEQLEALLRKIVEPPQVKPDVETVRETVKDTP